MKVALFILLASFAKSAELSDYCKGFNPRLPLLERNIEEREFLKLFNNSEVLGSGTYGEVRRLKLGRSSLAVKRVDFPTNEIDMNSQAQELFFISKAMLSKSGPDYHACFYSDPHLYIVQEKLHSDLDSASVLVVLKNLPVIERLKKYRLIATKFVDLHKAGIIHEDVKPQNIMTTDEDLTNFKLIDFGISKTREENAYLGSPAFNTDDKKIFPGGLAIPFHDIYALGITFAVLESNFNSVIKGVDADCFLRKMNVNCQKNLANNIKKILEKSKMTILEDIILKATHLKSPGYKSMEEMVRDLNRVIDENRDNLEVTFDKNQYNDLIDSQRMAKAAKENITKAIKCDKDYLEKNKLFQMNKEFYNQAKYRPQRRTRFVKHVAQDDFRLPGINNNNQQVVEAVEKKNLEPKASFHDSYIGKIRRENSDEAKLDSPQDKQKKIYYRNQQPVRLASIGMPVPQPEKNNGFNVGIPYRANQPAKNILRPLDSYPPYNYQDDNVNDQNIVNRINQNQVNFVIKMKNRNSSLNPNKRLPSMNGYFVENNANIII